VFLESILSGLTVGVIVMDSQLNPLLCNQRARDMGAVIDTDAPGRAGREAAGGESSPELKEVARAFLFSGLQQDRRAVRAADGGGPGAAYHVNCNRLTIDPRTDPEGTDKEGVVMLIENGPGR
jgi:nitrogen fixation/metabolism regulation signal transduction histidine kinase